MRNFFLLTFLLTSYFFGFAVEPDLIVLQSGESIKAFNLDITPGDNIYFSLTESSDSPIKKLSKSDILIIKKADGSKIDPSEGNEQAHTPAQQSAQVQTSISHVNPHAHEPITVNALESDFVELKTKGFKNPEKYILIEDGLGNALNARLLSSYEKTLSIAKPRKGMKYNYERIVFPEYVIINNEKYLVTEIDDRAFDECRKIKDIIFPESLKIIGKGSFTFCTHVKNLILPESIEKVEASAFVFYGAANKSFEYIYIPKHLKDIGQQAFNWVGPNVSPYNKYFQGMLISLPDWITIGNCHNFGIDENAVEEYERRNGLRK